MKCPKCKNQDTRKDGYAKGKQRFNCKNCNYHFTVEKKSTVASEFLKKNALQLYLEGLDFRAIGRFLQVSHVAVYKWIKDFGEKLGKIKSEQKIEIVELDELRTYICQKKTIIGYGLLLIEMGKNSSTVYWVQGEQEKMEKCNVT
jgi:transposase-like protein